jgi:hypothetical protein
MNNNLPVSVPGQMWYDTKSLELKFYDGDDQWFVQFNTPEDYTFFVMRFG